MLTAEEQLTAEVRKLRSALKFIAMMSMTALQSAVDPERRVQMLWEIRHACFDKLPDWWNPDDGEEHE